MVALPCWPDVGVPRVHRIQSLWKGTETDSICYFRLLWSSGDLFLMLATEAVNSRQAKELPLGVYRHGMNHSWYKLPFSFVPLWGRLGKGMRKYTCRKKVGGMIGYYKTMTDYKHFESRSFLSNTYTSMKLNGFPILNTSFHKYSFSDMCVNWKIN